MCCLFPPGELPHLMYLLTLYPVMAVIVNVCYYVYTPLAVMHFAIKGYTRFHNIAENKHSTVRWPTGSGYRIVSLHRIVSITCDSTEFRHPWQ